MPKNYTKEETKGKWITVRGRHILVKDGESVEDAFARSDKAMGEKKKVDASSKEYKQKQLDIITKNNPKDKNVNSQATWVESISDIHTWKEAMEDESSGYAGEDVAPDFKWEDAQKALKNGYIMVYSSKPIKQGSFITPSKMIAVSYGNKNPYSMKVKLEDVAWIDLSEGQFAKLEDK